MSGPSLHDRIRARCVALLATLALHPSAIAAEVSAPVAEVNQALRFDWHRFRQVAGPGCFLWTLTTSPIGIEAQREVVRAYAPQVFAPMRKNSDLAEVETAPAIIRALLITGPASVEALAAAVDCHPATIQQQAAKFSKRLQVTKELVPGKYRKRHQWRITRIALVAGGATP